jgi:type I restriction enzyme S subunit
VSKVDELIGKYCPHGVEYRQLGDIEDAGLIKLGRGSVISKKDIAAEPGDYPIYSSSASGIGEFGRYAKYMFEDERLSWSVDGGGRFFYRHAHKYSVTNVSGWLKVLDHSRLSTKYLYYALDSAWATKKFDYTKKAHPSVIRNEYRIPVPPLAVQLEIVKILDIFTQLGAELNAEQKARIEQYEYYLEKTISNHDWPEMTVLDMLSKPITDGPHETPKFVEQGVPFISAEAVSDGKIDFNKKRGYITKEYDDICAKKYKPQRGDVYMVKSGSTTGKVAMINTDEDFNIWSPLAAMRVSKSNNARFLYHLLKSKSIQAQVEKRASRGSQPNLSMRTLEKFIVRVPTLEEQNRIVEILDSLDQLVNDTSLGLPAELIARRKQYEYYRTKLLVFQELPS